MVKKGGIACVIGPVHPTFWLSRLFADAWMLFPTEAEYIEVQVSNPHPLILPLCILVGGFDHARWRRPRIADAEASWILLCLIL